MPWAIIARKVAHTHTHIHTPQLSAWPFPAYLNTSSSTYSQEEISKEKLESTSVMLLYLLNSTPTHIVVAVQTCYTDEYNGLG